LKVAGLGLALAAVAAKLIASLLCSVDPVRSRDVRGSYGDLSWVGNGQPFFPLGPFLTEK